MKNLSKSTTFSIILFCFFVCVLLFWEQRGNGGVSHVSRTGEVILENDSSDAEDNPFILEVKVASETPEQIIFDVEYFMSDQAIGTYNISIHPNNSDWAQSMNTMRAGLNTERITVSYKPKVGMKQKSQSDSLLIYINRYEDNVYKGKVFDRTLAFSKTWARY